MGANVPALIVLVILVGVAIALYVIFSGKDRGGESGGQAQVQTDAVDPETATKVQKLLEDIRALQNKTDSVRTDLDDLNTSHVRRLDTLDSLLASQSQEVDGLKSASDSQGQRVDALNALVTTQGQEVDGLKSASESQKQRVDGLNALVTTQTQKVDGLQTKVDTSLADYDTNKKYILDTLNIYKDVIGDLKDDVGMLFRGSPYAFAQVRSDVVKGSGSPTLAPLKRLQYNGIYIDEGTGTFALPEKKTYMLIASLNASANMWLLLAWRKEGGVEITPRYTLWSKSTTEIQQNSAINVYKTGDTASGVELVSMYIQNASDPADRIKPGSILGVIQFMGDSLS